MNPELALALELADIADAISAARFRAADLVVSTKPDRTPVTEADKAVEAALREKLASARPDHAVLGEEEGATGAADASARWIIDPIDGTANYLRGIPVWATLIALEENGELVVGVVSAPAMNQRWWAARGEGAFANDEPIRVSQVSRIEDAHLCSDGFDSWERHGGADKFMGLVRRVWRTRGFGDFWQHMLVADGSVDVAIEPAVNLWDLAAIQVIVEEAGGRFTDLNGDRRADGGNCCSSNGLLHDDVLAALS